MESKVFDRIKSRYGWIKKLLLALSLGPLLLELGVPDDYTFRNVTAQELPQEKKNWLLMTLIILWTCLSLILLFLENRLFRIYKCMLKRGVYALQGNLDFSGGLSDIFKQCGKLMYMSDKLSDNAADFTAACETNGIGVDEIDAKE